MEVLQSNQFKKQIKKLPPVNKKVLDEAVKVILNNPAIGEKKLGDLKGVSVYKFKLHHQMLLLAYIYSSDGILLLSVGPHENFYRDLKR